MAQQPNKVFEADTSFNRTFSEEFKRSKVKDLAEKKISIADICRLYSVSRSSVYKWIYLYSTAERGVKTVVQMESEGQKVKELMVRVAELERIVGLKQMTIDFLEKTLEMTSKDIGYDAKKKHSPDASSTSEKISQQSNLDLP